MKINFLLGFSRSGTSIVMSYLRAHKQVETGYEEPNHLWRLMGHKKWKDGYTNNLGITEKNLTEISDNAIKAFTETFYSQLAEKTRKQKIVLKHPWLVPYTTELIRIFPESKFVFLWRHPYDVIASTLDFAENDDIANSMFGTELDGIVNLYKNHVKKLFEAREVLDRKKLFEIKFEDFIRIPKHLLKQVFKFLGARTSEEDLNEVISGKYIVKTARVLTDLKLNAPEKKFLKLKTEDQKFIIKNLYQTAKKLEYDTMEGIVKKEE